MSLASLRGLKQTFDLVEVKMRDHHNSLHDQAKPGDSIFHSSLGSYTNTPVVVKRQFEHLDGSSSQGIA